VRGPGRRRLTRLATALALALVGLTVSPAHAAAGPAGLPRLDITRTYVAGFSSGGYMATQLQVA
jgi:hypothetical protein